MVETLRYFPIVPPMPCSFGSSSNRFIAIVATSVREQIRREHREITAIASGVNRNFDTPFNIATGANTIQMQSVPTSARHRDLMRAVENRNCQRLSHRVIAMDILNLDGGVIDRASRPTTRGR